MNHHEEFRASILSVSFDIATAIERSVNDGLRAAISLLLHAIYGYEIRRRINNHFMTGFNRHRTINLDQAVDASEPPSVRRVIAHRIPKARITKRARRSLSIP